MPVKYHSWLHPREEAKGVGSLIHLKKKNPDYRTEQQGVCSYAAVCTGQHTRYSGWARETLSLPSSGPQLGDFNLTEESYI